jgi:hypothetical protein
MLCCTKCKLTYHYLCINLTTAYFREHSNILRQSWECPECSKKIRRANNDCSPIRSQGVTSTPQQDSSLLNDPYMTANEGNPAIPKTVNLGPTDISTSPEKTPTQLESDNITQRRQQQREHSIESSFLDSTIPDGATITSIGDTTNLDLLREIRELRTHITSQAQKQESRDCVLTESLKLMQLGIDSLNNKYTLLETEHGVLKTMITKNTDRINELCSENRRLRQEISELRKTATTPLEVSSLNLTTQVDKHNDTYADNLAKSKTPVTEPQKKQPQNPPVENSRMLVLYGLDETRFETESLVHNRVINAFFDITQVDLTGYIEDLVRIGHRGRRRPLKIELLSKRMTRYLLSNVKMFRNTGLWISPLLDENGLQERKSLREKQRDHRIKNRQSFEDFRSEQLDLTQSDHTRLSNQIINKSQRGNGQPFRT